MKKIGIVTEYYYPLIGGIPEHIYNYAKCVSALGHELTIITGKTSGEIDRNYKLDNVDITRIGQNIPIYSNNSFSRVTLGLNIGAKLKDIFDYKKFDVVHVHSPLFPILPLLAVKYSKTLTVGTFHTYFPGSYWYNICKKAQIIIDKLNGQIAVSKNSIDAIEKYFHGNFKIIPNGVDIKKFSNGKKLQTFCDDNINILFVGRPDPRNGIHYTLDAFKLVKKEYPKARLIILGDGPLKKLYEKSIDKNIKQNVIFAGRVLSGREDFYKTADIFCFPIQRATCSITLLEAMAAGKPIVTTNIQSLKDILSPDKEALFVNYGSTKELADKILQLIYDANLRTTLGERAKLKANEYSWEKITKQILDYYNECNN